MTSVCLLYPSQSSDPSLSWVNVDGKGSLDLSTATKLKDVVFTSGGPFRWINTAMETIKSEDLEQVTIVSQHVHVDHREWGDLDRLLAQLWTSRSIRPTITFSREGKMMGLAPELLPKLTKEGRRCSRGWELTTDD